MFAVCKHSGMEQATSPSEFAAAAGISIPYASQLLNNKRSPSRPLAISIYRKTGRKFGPIAGLSDADIDTLERIEAAA